jgi:hypothetical protein
VTIDLPTAAIATGAGAVGWFLLRLTVFDAIKELRASTVRLGVRIGALESRLDARDAVDNYLSRRRNSRAEGVPIQTDDE